MTEFVASNGIRVYLDESRSVQWSGSVHGERKDRITQAFREFFQHERDAELGRWRSKINPDVVVYTAKEDDYRQVEFVNERTREVTLFARWEAELLGGDSVYAEFFAAHPEPKPWESAKPGEVWRLTVHGKEREYATIMGRATFPHPVDHLYFMPTTDVSAPKLGAKATVISAGRRLYPEVSE